MSYVAEKVKKALKGGETEDVATSTIENVTSKVPSTTFLGLALGALGIGVACQMTGRKNLGNFIAQLAPTILIMGLYNKVVKQHGH
jgi:hypothetical protein